MGKTSRLLITACGVLLVMALSTVAFGYDLNVVSDFPMSQGDNGFWAYAFRPSSSTFRLLPNYQGKPGIFASPEQSVIPQVVKNAAGEVKLHPQVDGTIYGTEWAVLQFKAPATGSYRFNVEFYSATGTSTPCSTRALIFLDTNSAAPLFQGLVGANTQQFGTTLTLQKDQLLNFAVDATASALSDTTGLRQLEMSAVPEPGSLVALGGLLGSSLIGLRRRKVH